MEGENEMELSREWKYKKKGRKMRFLKVIKSLVVFSLFVLLCTGNMQYVYAQSQSTEKVDLTISSVKDFNTFITRMKNGDDFTGKIVKVTADIDFSGAEFTQIPSFGGTFDGSGHTFSGISGISGLIDTINSTGTVKNLSIKESTFTNKYGNDLIGTIAIRNDGTIENCISNASNTITGNVDTGGIVFSNSGTIINCANYSDIIIKKSTNYVNSGNHGNIGGIALANSGKIINCYNQGNLINNDNLITAGITYNNNGQVINCYNTGTALYGISYNGTNSSCVFLGSASDTAMPGTYSDNNALSMTQSDMSADSFVAKLNKGAANSEGALTWEKGALYPQLVPTYEVTFEKNYINGTVGSNYSYTTKGTIVTLTSKPADKYYTKSLTINTEDGIAIDVTAKGSKFIFTMPGDNVVVSASFSTVATPNSVTYTKSSKTISWGTVTDASGYEVYRSTSKTVNFKLLTSESALNYADVSAASSKTYYYKVRAYVLVDGVKVYSSLSSVVSSK
jgi:hypothetical protein